MFSNSTTLYKAAVLSGAVALGVRAWSVVSSAGGIGYSSEEKPTASVWLGLVHVVAFAFSLGTMMWMSFVSGLTLMRTIPRHTFGSVQKQLFPKYFQWTTISCSLLTETLHHFSADPASRTGTVSSGLSLHALLVSRNTQCYLLLTALLGMFLNLIYLEPWTRSIMIRRHKREDEIDPSLGNVIGQLPKPPTDPALIALTMEFGKAHGWSLLLDMLAILALILHAYFLAARLNL